MDTRVRSFTLSELLVVMLLTVIVVGMAFSVVRLVQEHISKISENMERSTNLSLFQQRMWQDFSRCGKAQFDPMVNRLRLISEIDTVSYDFQEDFTLRNTDTIKLQLAVDKVFFHAKEDSSAGTIDAVSITAEKELPGYAVFFFKENDATYYMNNDGF